MREMNVKSVAVSSLLFCSIVVAACGGGNGRTGSDGAGITTQTTFQGNLIDDVGPVAGVSVCIQGTNPLVCATTDQDGDFAVAAEVLGQIILSFGDGGLLSLCLSGVPEGATITLNDVACTIANGSCAPVSMDVAPVPAVAIQVCNGSEPTPTPTPADADGDGKNDDDDLCPGTPQGEVVDADGCSVAQLVPCAGDWTNHGDYVSAFTQAANDYVQGGFLTAEQRDALVAAAAASDCGGNREGTPTPTPTPDPQPGDSDGDGVEDESDACPDTPPGEPVDSQGCSVGQLVPCGGDWTSHGDYVSAIVATANDFLDAGLLTEAQRNAVVNAAAQSDCGKSEGGDSTPTPIEIVAGEPGDSDGDGVNDEGDACADTAAGAVVDTTGCSVEQLAPCGGDWRNHGEYVSTVAEVSKDFVDAGSLTSQQRADLVSAAAHSSCGRIDGPDDDDGDDEEDDEDDDDDED